MTFTFPTSGPLQLSLTADLPPGTHVNAEAPMQVKVTGPDGAELLRQSMPGAAAAHMPFAVSAELTVGAARPTTGSLSVLWSLAYCTEGEESKCVPTKLRWTVALESTGGSFTTLVLRGKVR